MRVSRFHRLVSFSTLFVLFSSILLGLGCRAAPESPNPSETPTAQAASNSTTLTVWHTFTDEPRETFDALAQAFHKIYPDLAINAVYVGSRDDLTKQMTAAIALGNAPDLVLAERQQIADFARQGGLQSLENFIGDPELGLAKEDKTDFLDGALRLGAYPTLGKRTYGFPFDQEAFVLFYNVDALKKINVNRAPRTWEQFGKYATAVTQAPLYGWAMRPSADTLEAMLVSRGSALLTNAETRALFNERAGLASLKLVADLYEGGAAELAASDEQAQRAFAAGNAAFYMGWMSELAKLEALQKESKSDFEIGVAPLPQLDAQEPWLLARGALFGLTVAPEGHTDAPRARKAWFFVRWITAPTQSAQWVRATEAIPLRASTLTFLAPDLNENARIRQIAAGFDGVAPQLAPQPAPPYLDSIEQQIGELWLLAVQPKPELATILDAAARRVNQILAMHR
ncbi:MAG: extracellular solute-binding protein [Chloroflexi bacterium]|nr:extracellular solute-binding protein [Chloroflexota bacterium]